MSVTAADEIHIAVKVVGKEARADLKDSCHGSDIKRFKLKAGEVVLYGVDISAAECLVFFEVKLHLFKVGVVFRAGICAEAYGVAEIICRKSRHDRVKVNYGKRFVGICVEHYVVALCVVMRDSERQLAGFICVFEEIDIVFLSENIAAGFVDLGPSAADIFFIGRLQVPDTFRGVVEIRYGFLEGLNRIFRKLCEEAAEGFSGAFKYFCVGEVYAHGIVYIGHEPPVAFIVVDIELFAVLCLENALHKPLFVGALRQMIEYV